MPLPSPDELGTKIELGLFQNDFKDSQIWYFDKDTSDYSSYGLVTVKYFSVVTMFRSGCLPRGPFVFKFQQRLDSLLGIYESEYPPTTCVAFVPRNSSPEEQDFDPLSFQPPAVRIENRVHWYLVDFRCPPPNILHQLRTGGEDDLIWVSLVSVIESIHGNSDPRLMILRLSPISIAIVFLQSANTSEVIPRDKYDIRQCNVNCIDVGGLDSRVIPKSGIFKFGNMRCRFKVSFKCWGIILFPWDWFLLEYKMIKIPEKEFKRNLWWIWTLS